MDCGSVVLEDARVPMMDASFQFVAGQALHSEEHVLVRFARRSCSKQAF